MGHWVILFLLGAFMIAHAMTVSGLNRRFAYRMISFEFIGGNSWPLADGHVSGSGGDAELDRL